MIYLRRNRIYENNNNRERKILLLYILLVLWIIIALGISLVAGKQIYKKCRTHIHFVITIATEKEQTNGRKKIHIQVKNEGITKILITELGIRSLDIKEFYSFHKLTDHSAPLPSWLAPNQTIEFIQNLMDIPFEFRDKTKEYAIYAKDDQGKVYYETYQRKDEK